MVRHQITRYDTKLHGTTPKCTVRHFFARFMAVLIKDPPPSYSKMSISSERLLRFNNVTSQLKSVNAIKTVHVAETAAKFQ